MSVDYDYMERKYTMKDVKRLHPEDGIVIRLRRLFWYHSMFWLGKKYENSPHDNPTTQDPFIRGVYKGMGADVDRWTE